MANEKDRVIKSICAEMTDLDEKSLKKLENLLYIKLHNYDLTVKSTELTVIDNDDEVLIKNFLADKLIGGMKENSCEAYTNELRGLSGYLNKSLLDITKSDIKHYIAYLKEIKKLKNTTISTRTHYFSSFFTWAFNERFIAENPTSGIKAIKLEQKIEREFTLAEVEALMNTAKKARDKALIQLMLSTGARIDEIVKLNRNDIDYANREVKVFGKGHKERYVYINDKACYYMNEYMNSRTDDNSALFINKNKYRISITGIEKMLKGIGSKANIDNVHPHRFRKTCATYLASKGMPIEQISKLLGHASVNTTMIYVNVDRQNVKNNCLNLAI